MTGSAIHRYPKDTRDKLFLLSVAATTLIAWHPLRALLDAALKHEQNSHILLVLPIVVGLLYLEGAGRNIKPETAALPGAVLLVVSGLLAITSFHYGRAMGPANTLSLSIAALVFAWLGLVFAFYGVHIFKKCIFPLLFLLLLVPLPPSVLNAVTYTLQYGSTRATEALFIAFGIPVAREGFVLFLPSIDIEVAAECSGIRSSMMLVLTCVVLGHLFLRSPWRQCVLFVSVIAVTILKNALRIFTLATLAMYVDPSWIEGDFHHLYGGSIFFALAMAIILVVLRLLRRSEEKPKTQLQPPPVHAGANLT
jgi:exosortase